MRKEITGTKRKVSLPPRRNPKRVQTQTRSSTLYSAVMPRLPFRSQLKHRPQLGTEMSFILIGCTEGIATDGAAVGIVCIHFREVFH
jgi:hypothetical protein